MEYKLRDVTPDNLAELQVIGRETFYETYADGNNDADLSIYLKQAFGMVELTKEVNNPDSYFKLIICDDQIAGYFKINVGNAQTEAEGESALEVERIYIKQAFKRHGIGTKIIEHAIDQARQLHKQFVWLGVWEHNEPAKQFYTKMGFKPFSEHQFPMGNEFQRDILMKKTI